MEANIAKFTDAMSQAEMMAKRSSDNIVKALSGIGGAIAGMVSVGVLDAAFTRITDMEAGLVKMATRLNTTASTLASFGGIARQAQMDSDTFNMALTRMEKNLSAAVLGTEASSGKLDENGEEIIKAAAAYDQLGIKVKEFQELPLDQKLMVISEQMKKNIDPADRVGIAMQVFGKAGAGLVTPLSQGGDALERLIAREKELNPLTDEMAKRGALAKSAASELSVAWTGFATTLEDKVAPAITGILNKLTDLITASKNKQFLETSATLEKNFGPQAAAKYSQEQIRYGSAAGVGPYGEAAETFYPTPLPQGVTKPPVRPAPPAAKGGGGGAGAGLSALMNQVDQLEKEYANLTEGMDAGIDKWAEHALNKLRGVDEVMKDPAAARARGEDLVPLIAIEKKKQAELDYNTWLANIYHDTDFKTAAEQYSMLIKHTGDAQKQEEIIAAFAFQKAEERAKKESEIWSQEKGYYDTLAGLAPLLSGQLVLKQRALDLEIQIGKAALERDIIEKRIPEAQANELRGLQALTDQAKKYDLERQKWQTQGIGGGLQMGAFDLSKSAETWAADTTAALVKNMPQKVSSEMASSFIGFLQGKKPDLQQLGMDMAQCFIQTTLEGVLNQIIPTLAQGVAGIFGEMGGGGGGIFESILGGIGGLFGLRDGGLLPGSFNALPGFADGTIISRPTLGWIGEGSGPEAVIPLRGGSIPVDMQGNGGGGDTHYHNYHNEQISLSPTIIIKGDITPAEAEKLWRNVLAPAAKRQLDRYHS
ncbi:MAG: hypothetical protein ACHQ2F_03265 [Desulfobaccales bacterium]